MEKLKKYWYIILPIVLLAIYMLLDKVMYSTKSLAERCVKMEKAGNAGGNPTVEYYTNLADSGAFINIGLVKPIVTKPISKMSLMEKMTLSKELTKAKF